MTNQPTKKVVTATIREQVMIARGIYKLVLQETEVAKSARAGQFVNVYLNDQAWLLPRPISICEISEDEVILVYGVVGKGTEILAGYGPGTEIRLSTANGNGFDTVGFGFNVSGGSSPSGGPSMSGVPKTSGESSVSGATSISGGANMSGAPLNRLLLVGGGIGVPPMVQLAKELHRQKQSGAAFVITALIGFQEAPFLTEKLKEYCDEVHVTTDSGGYGFHGNVVEFLKVKQLAFDHCFACGPKAMLKALCAYCNQLRIPIQVSLEERMGCGYGACVGCVCKIRPSDEGRANSSAQNSPSPPADQQDQKAAFVYRKVCQDGPVFAGSEVIFDE